MKVILLLLLLIASYFSFFRLNKWIAIPLFMIESLLFIYIISY